jgi:hypothetical protein
MYYYFEYNIYFAVYTADHITEVIKTKNKVFFNLTSILTINRIIIFTE